MKSIHVDIEKSNIIQVFSSEGFYDSWKVFIRELLQNAFDACNAKQALELSWGTEFLEIEQAEQVTLLREPYNAQIKITYNSDSMMFSIEDNGIGINEYDLEHFVARVGESYYTSDVYKRNRVNYEPISRHGLGLVSCFMVARAILIESKKDRYVNTAWNVDSPEDLTPIMAKWFEDGSQIEYVESKRKNSGTKITLPLKSAYGPLIDMKFLLWEIKHYTMYQPIPITIIVDDEEVKLHQKEMPWRFPHNEVLGSRVIEVDTDLLEGYVALYNSRQKDFFGKSELFQQNIRVTEVEESLGLQPEWLENFTYQLNIKKRFLNLNISRTTAVRDEKLSELRLLIGQLLIDYFGKSPANLGLFLSDGKKRMICEYDAENQLVSRAVFVSVFLKGKLVDVPIRTVINGFMGRKISIAYMARELFDYYMSGYVHDCKEFLDRYDMVIFEKNIMVFMQYFFPYVTSQEYVIRDIPGLIFTDIKANLSEEKTLPTYINPAENRPEGCKDTPVFCLVSNELDKPLELIFNPYNRNAALLINARRHEPVRKLMAIIAENIKRRIITKSKWDKIIDFGGEFLDDYTGDKVLSLQSVWCLEAGFADELNRLVVEMLPPAEIVKCGLSSLFFTDEDFISWWFWPKQ